MNKNNFYMVRKYWECSLFFENRMSPERVFQSLRLGLGGYGNISFVWALIRFVWALIRFVWGFLSYVLYGDFSHTMGIAKRAKIGFIIHMYKL